jgi:signal transduction histidine kinase
MSLKKKIILSFLISSVIIAILGVSSYTTFLEIKKEIRFLELSDTLRSKTLQLRRHEKNFFLYRDLKEIEIVYRYLKEIKEILEENTGYGNAKQLMALKEKINEYQQKFNYIEINVWNVQKEFLVLKPLRKQYEAFFPLIESTFLENPSVNSRLIRWIFALPEDSAILRSLGKLDIEIKALRRNGEEVLAISKDLDRSAREKVEKAIYISQLEGLIFFPIAFLVGLGALFMISHSVVKRLKILTRAIEKTGKGSFLPLHIPQGQDEVGVLISSFNKMEEDLAKRENELAKKTDELLQSRKLASIGTLASGVAHELNNPLNNIYISAQVLSREIEHESFSPSLKETIEDIFSESLRVKRIVSELLEFSREKPPELKKVNLVEVISSILEQMKTSGELFEAEYDMDTQEDIMVDADSYMLQQVFINLITNAVDAMDHRGLLNITISSQNSSVLVKIADTGKGINPDDMLRIFDPFFTTKEKGTGLGLAVVYSIVQKHKGKIEVESSPDSGTTFTIILPREQ